MNKRQKEVAEVNLKAEQQVLRNLKAVYRKAAEDCAEKAKSLLGEGEVTQSKIYQAKYQQALEKQLNVILGKINKNSYSTISEYLEDCYNNGFIGAMYDIAGQGIPVISPINQSQIVQSVQLNSKISEGLYKRMGKDTVKLKKQIKAQISRGISNGSSYTEIARNINLKADIGYNNSVRIARTEGHRIQIDSALDAQYAAKEKGADIVKQWDSTLDGDTRSHHRLLDGQIREIDDDFEIDGRKVSAPGHFNDPAEDCNCRCALLQRARWALDDDELEELKKRAEYFGLDKTKDFADFKSKYLKAAETLDNSVESGIINIEEVNSMAEIIKLGKIKTQPLENEFGKLKTDEIIITNERIEHIKIRHPEDFDLFEQYGVQTVESPDVIIKDCKNQDTIFMIKKLKDTNLNIVAKLILDIEDNKLINSVMTFYRIRNKNLIKLEKKNKILYKKE